MFVVDLDREVPVSRCTTKSSATTRRGLRQRAWYFVGGLALCAVLAGSATVLPAPGAALAPRSPNYLQLTGPKSSSMIWEAQRQVREEIKSQHWKP